MDLREGRGGHSEIQARLVEMYPAPYELMHLTRREAVQVQEKNVAN